jgi:hypothetical protein
MIVFENKHLEGKDRTVMPIKKFVSNLLERQMTRKEFISWSALLLASVFGVGGLLQTLMSHADADTPGASESTDETDDSSSDDTAVNPTLLWEPDYSKELSGKALDTGLPDSQNGGMIPGRLWRAVQPPYVRGVPQFDRFNILTHADVPGSTSDPYRPVGAMHVEIQPTSTTKDFTIDATAAASTTATTVSFSKKDAKLLVYPGLGQATEGDFIGDQETREHMRVTAQPVNGVVSVLRAQESAAGGVAVGDPFTVYTGDINPMAGFSSRSEVYGRFATDSSVNPVNWPDPVGSTRWYGISYYLPADMDTITGQGWWICTQFKGEFGGSPPLALSIDWTSDTENGKGTWKLQGTKGHPTVSIGDIKLGTWTRILFGIHWDNVSVENGGAGWIKIYRDGDLIVPKTPACTMDSHGSGADPIYFKNGIYRSDSWKVTHDAYIGAPKIGTSMEEVLKA